jgi:hypothetical protein
MKPTRRQFLKITATALAASGNTIMAATPSLASHDNGKATPEIGPQWTTLSVEPLVGRPIDTYRIFADYDHGRVLIGSGPLSELETLWNCGDWRDFPYIPILPNVPCDIVINHTHDESPGSYTIYSYRVVPACRPTTQEVS